MELKNVKVNFLGDSITHGVGASSPDNRYASVFARKTGADVIAYGLNGTRIARQTTPSQWEHFDRDFNERYLTMREDADVVVVFGGTNDFGHGDAPFGTPEDRTLYTFCGAWRLLLEGLIEKYPIATIVVMTPLHRLSELEPVNEMGMEHKLLSEYVDMEKKIAAEYSVPVLDLWSVSGIQPRIKAQCDSYTVDGLHPNDKGHEKIADLLIAYLKSSF